MRKLSNKQSFPQFDVAITYTVDKTILHKSRNGHSHPLLYVVKSSQEPEGPTCYLPFPQSPPEFFCFPQRPSLNLGAKTAEEFVILKVRHIQWATSRTAPRRCTSPTDDDAPLRTDARATPKLPPVALFVRRGTWQSGLTRDHEDQTERKIHFITHQEYHRLLGCCVARYRRNWQDSLQTPSATNILRVNLMMEAVSACDASKNFAGQHDVMSQNTSSYQPL